jgi:exodeoxyribonuclease-3
LDPRSFAVKIASWNVNSLRAREDLVLDWIDEHQPDVLCMQETKLTDQEFPEDAFGDAGYDVVYFGQRAYNGVAIATKHELKDVVRGFAGAGADDDRRLIAATINGVRIIDIYLPNGQELGSDKYQFKLGWIEGLLELLKSGPGPDTPLLVCGDYNIAPIDLDVWDAVERNGGLFVSKAERDGFQRLLDWGLTDAFRHFEPKALKAYSWWDYRAGSWERNRGMRIDHFLITKPLLARAKSVTIHRAMRGKPQPSDHVPVVLEIAD